MGVVRPANLGKVGDPVDNTDTSEVAFQNLSIMKGHDKPIYLESENKWFENMKLLRFYQKYDQESLQRFEYNNPKVNVINLVKSQ